MTIEDYKQLLNTFNEYARKHNMIVTKTNFINWIKSNHFERKFSLYWAEQVYFSYLEDCFGI